MHHQIDSLRNDLYLVFQPIVRRLSSHNSDMTEFEVLLRTIRSHTYPDDFMDYLIATDERNGELMAWYSEEMIQIFEKHPTYRFSINLHPQQLIHSSTWVFLKSLNNWRDRIQIEVTEKPFLASCKEEEAAGPSLCESMRAINQMGYRLSFDDVGTGVNSLEMVALNIRGVSTLKFSVQNFRHIAPEVLNHFITAWRAFSDFYKIRLVVEGVETQSMADYLFANGIEWQQGYYWADKVAL